MTRAPSGVGVVGGDSAAALTAAVSGALFASAQSVLVSSAAEADATTTAATAAASMHLPLLLEDGAANGATSGGSGAPDPLEAEVERLGVTTVVAVGPGLETLGEQLPGVEVVVAPAGASGIASATQDLAGLPAPPALTETTVLTRNPSAAAGLPEQDAVTLTAVGATARAAGARVVASSTADPRADQAAVKAIEGASSESVLAVGGGFGRGDRLARRVSVAATGVQLPGGGQVMFPGRALVALYGHPSGKSLGALGEQGPQASVARAKQLAAAYDPYYTQPVVPTFEIIATVASGSAGKDGDYSQEWSVDSLTPFVDAATDAGMYVILDLQPGRADLVEQATAYRSLLERPNVGLAIDPEWALTSGQKPLQQIGSVSAAQVNEVVAWLAELTRAKNLPQKVLVVHEFRTSMVRDVGSLDVSRDEVAVLIHADGQGRRSAKEATWRSIVAAAPDGVRFGWKNFYDEDPQMAGPRETARRTPVPLMVSYQ